MSNSRSDLFGRGYSSGPSPKLHNYDAALYTTQILLCLASSPISWRPITLVGYSLGGALAADFTSQFPHLISNLFLIAPGGIIRSSHITWKSKLLYSTGGLLPEWMKEKLVASRLYTGPGSTRVPEPETELEAGSGVTRVRGSEDDVYNSSHHRLLSSNPHSTVGNVVDWQLKYHVGFVPAFISSIRYAPIHEQQHRWQRIGEYMNGGPLTPPPPPPEEEAVAPPPSEAGSTSGRRRRRRSDASAVSTSTTSSRRKRSHKNSSSDGFGWFMKSSSSKSKSSKSSSSKESTKSTSTKETHKKSESRDKTSEPRLLKKVYLILGETDPIIIAEEVAQDAREVLGEEHVRVKIMEGVGHEVAIERAEEISELIGRALKL